MSFLDPSLDPGVLEEFEDEDSVSSGDYEDEQDDDKTSFVSQKKGESTLEWTLTVHCGSDRAECQFVPYKEEYQCKWCKEYRVDIASKSPSEKFCSEQCKTNFLKAQKSQRVR